RAIESPVVTAGLREGYHTALMKGQFPVTFLFLNLDPASVDVNVHPPKREVRFRDPTGVREAVVNSIRRALEGGRGDWQERFRAPNSSPLSALPIERETRPIEVQPAFAQQTIETLPRVAPSGFEGPRKLPDTTTPVEERIDKKVPQQFQIIGVLNKLYVLMENADGLVLVDQHAAHERILFEELRRRMEEQGVPAQKLLITQTFELPPRDADWIEQNLSILPKMGIGIAGFGSNTFKIDAVPSFLNVSDPGQFMRK